MDMTKTLPPLMLSLGLLTTGSLLESLIHISNEVASIAKLPFIQIKNFAKMIRRIFLSSLFEEIKETNVPLPPSSILCLTELFSVIRKAMFLIEGCKEGSHLWNLLQTKVISNQFHVAVKEFGTALYILPLILIKITDTKEQVELLRRQLERAELYVEAREIQKREELLLVIGANNDRNIKNKNVIDFHIMKEIVTSIGV